MDKVNIYVGARINIQIPSGVLAPEIQSLLVTARQENTIPNPEYAAAVKQGRFVGNIQQNIILTQIESDGLSLPRGYAGRLLQLARHFGVEYSFKDVRRELPMMLFRSKIELRDYQCPAVTGMLRGTQGVLEAPAGSGKTSMGMEIVARVGQPALWITHTNDLAEQAADRAKQYLGLVGSDIGLIGNGKRQIGNKLTIGMVQTLSGMSTKDFEEIAGLFGLVIIDEAHHIPANLFASVVDRLPARWRYGVTATKERADGLTTLIDRFLGPTLAKVPRAAVEASGGVVVPELRTIKTTTTSESYQKHGERMERYDKLCEELKQRDIPYPRKPMLQYSYVLDDILRDKGRNQLVLDTLKSECPGHCSLVLSERVEHCKDLELSLALETTLRVATISGKLNKGKRDSIIKAMSNGDLDVLLAVDIAKEGLDIPRLDRLFILGGGKNEVEVEQKVGRIQRACSGKKDAVVFDFVDEEIGILLNQYWARRRVYKRLGMLGEKPQKVAI